MDTYDSHLESIAKPRVSTQLSCDIDSGKSYLIRSSALPIKKVGHEIDSRDVTSVER